MARSELHKSVVAAVNGSSQCFFRRTAWALLNSLDLCLFFPEFWRGEWFDGIGKSKSWKKNSSAVGEM